MSTNDKIKCPICGSSNQTQKTRTIKYQSPLTQKEMSIHEVPYFQCFDCDEDWQSASMFKEYQEMYKKAENIKDENERFI
jgi:YgiT-type zinc finger domain-containing protein